MPKYLVDVTLLVKGTVTVEAVDPHSAKEAITNGNFGAMLGDIQSTDDETFIDWDFDMHLESKAHKARRIYKRARR
jgi:hypothetical protein